MAYRNFVGGKSQLPLVQGFCYENDLLDAAAVYRKVQGGHARHFDQT